MRFRIYAGFLGEWRVVIDRLFRTHHLPEGQWPEGYGIAGHPVPSGYLRQFFYPFCRKPKKEDS